MPAMKITISAAMRARDVSRPRPEQLAEAEAETGEAGWVGEAGGPGAGGVRASAPRTARSDAGGGAGRVGGVAGEASVVAGGSGAAADGVAPVAGVRPSDRSGGRAERQHGARRRR